MASAVAKSFLCPKHSTEGRTHNILHTLTPAAGPAAASWPSPAGLANPGPIIAELWTDEELEAAVTLDGVVTLVDGRNISRQLGEQRPAGQPNEAQLQVALADVIVLNKVRGGQCRDTLRVCVVQTGCVCVHVCVCVCRQPGYGNGSSRHHRGLTAGCVLFIWLAGLRCCCCWGGGSGQTAVCAARQ